MRSQTYTVTARWKGGWVKGTYGGSQKSAVLACQETWRGCVPVSVSWVPLPPCKGCGKHQKALAPCGACLGCIKGWIDRTTPYPYHGTPRGGDKRQAYEYDGNPWQENAVRELEECR